MLYVVIGIMLAAVYLAFLGFCHFAADFKAFKCGIDGWDEKGWQAMREAEERAKHEAAWNARWGNNS